MIIDLTPKAWSGHDREQIAAVIVRTIEVLEVVELRVSRHKLIAETDPKNCSDLVPDQIEALRAELAQLGPIASGEFPSQYRSRLKEVNDD